MGVGYAREGSGSDSQGDSDATAQHMRRPAQLAFKGMFDEQKVDDKHRVI